ncbi:MAG: methyltransferase domain-containing protein, partial [bacterium]|nr:methyltransferase domain-containing protein [bacterium]
YNVEAAGYIDRIQLDQVDAKSLPYEDDLFDAVISNSIVHHIPDPKPAIEEALRVVKPGGLLYFRDLMRPQNAEQLNELVEQYAGNEATHARDLFRDSLHAALSLEEIQQLVVDLGYAAEEVTATSDRHWTWSTRKPAAAEA